MKQTSFLLIAALLCIGSISAQQQKTIFVPEAGTLKSQLTEEEAKNVTDLTLTGKINAIDFKAMRDEFNKLETLDISNANIRMYTGKKGTFSDKFYVYPMECVPAYAFKDKQTLKAIVLSPSLKNIEDCAFKGCKNLKRCYIKQKKTVNLLPDAMNDTLVAVFIPLGSKDVYRAKDKWKPYNLIEGEPISVEVIITEPGTLNQEILKTGKRPYEVNFLSVEGDLDRNDFKEIR
ncbi:MAG: leucine-rich repeat protein, partial [Bacteroides sp.]